MITVQQALAFRKADILLDGQLADRLRKLPPGHFCGWGGLNPHIAPVGSSEPATCRVCARNESCAEPWKGSAL